MIIRVGLAVLALQALAAAAWAQQAPAVDFFPETRFFMNAEHLSTDSIHYKWRADFHGEADLVRWPRGGRATFLANYEVVLGNEFRRFDPEQGNYTLQGAVTQQVGPVEVGIVFHHISRHVSDRFKRFAVDWNAFGVRVRKEIVRAPVTVTLQGDVRDIVARSFVDYATEAEGQATVFYAWRPRVGFVADTHVRVVGVDETYGRGTQAEFRTEGGVRFGGEGGSFELFLAGERRFDADVTLLGPRNWLAAGFRFRAR